MIDIDLRNDAEVKAFIRSREKTEKGIQTRIHSWRDWQDNGMIEIEINVGILEQIIWIYENQIEHCVSHSLWETAERLMQERKHLAEKLVEYYKDEHTEETRNTQ